MIKEKLKDTLTVSADDFGLNPLSNERILKLVEIGKIDRVAVLVNGLFQKEEIEYLKKSGVRLDLHLEIPMGKRRTGIFMRTIIFLARSFSYKLGNKKLEDEWHSQAEKFISIFSQKPDGLNSHQYVHFYPPYFKTFLKILKDFDIGFIRFGRRSFPESFRGNKISLILNWLRRIDLKIFGRGKAKTTDFLVSLDWIEDKKGFWENLPKDRTMEIVVHPEIYDDFEFVKKFF
ncbi:MAG: ChbG/HpnK family deacetylase [Patescibacteria group bacterium]